MIIIFIILILIIIVILTNVYVGSSQNLNRVKILSQYFDEYIMGEVFEEHGYVISNDPDILYRDGKKGTGKYAWMPKNKIFIINNLKVPNVEDKDTVYEYAKKYMPKQCNVNISDSGKKCFDGQLKIVRPIGKGYCSGKGIFIVDNHKEFKKKREPDVRYAVSDYIIDPMLIDNKKFHIRYYCLLADDNYYIPMPDISHVILALSDYKKGDWDNPDIHDTHYGDGSTSYPLSKLPNADIEKQILEIIKVISKHAKPQSYGDSKRSYLSLGYDFMVDSNNRVLLIEVNDRVGYAIPTPEDTKYVTEKNIEMIEHLKT